MRSSLAKPSSNKTLANAKGKSFYSSPMSHAHIAVASASSCTTLLPPLRTASAGSSTLASRLAMLRYDLRCHVVVHTDHARNLAMLVSRIWRTEHPPTSTALVYLSTGTNRYKSRTFKPTTMADFFRTWLSTLPRTTPSPPRSVVMFPQASARKLGLPGKIQCNATTQHHLTILDLSLVK